MQFLRRRFPKKFRPCWLLLLACAAVILLTSSTNGQIIVTAAGGWVGDGGQATKAGFVIPRYMARDARGNFYVSEVHVQKFAHRRTSDSGAELQDAERLAVHGLLAGQIPLLAAHSAS